MKNYCKNAVTLVELLIVVLLIGVMSFIAIPRMSHSTVKAGSLQAQAETVAAALRYTRSLAISSAAVNSKGFSFEIYSGGYRIVNLSDNSVVRSEKLPSAISFSGANDFDFSPLGNRTGDSDSLVLTGGDKSYEISVISATGLVKCRQKQ